MTLSIKINKFYIFILCVICVTDGFRNSNRRRTYFYTRCESPDSESKPCDEHSDCFNGKDNMICDPLAKRCCNIGRTSTLCPGSPIHALNEEPCVNITKTSNGTCLTNVGTCHLGHCCPLLHPNAPHNFSTRATQITNMICNPSQPVPESLSFAFCDVRTSRIVISGGLNARGEEMKFYGVVCSSTDECGLYKNVANICLRINASRQECLIHPMMEYSRQQRPHAEFPFVTSGLALICSLLTIIVLITMRCMEFFSTDDEQESSEGVPLVEE